MYAIRFGHFSDHQACQHKNHLKEDTMEIFVLTCLMMA